MGTSEARSALLTTTFLSVALRVSVRKKRSRDNDMRTFVDATIVDYVETPAQSN